jgi:hypothetical protein
LRSRNGAGIDQVYVADFCRNFGVGVSAVEAGFLSGEAGAEKISELLRDAAEYDLL